MDITKKFGKRVREMRLKKGMSQGDLAKILGVHANYVSGIERGLENMSLRKIEILAKALGISLGKLLQ